MKATAVKSPSPYAEHVLDHFGHLYNWKTYLAVKYEGFFPDNMPKSQDFKEVNEAIKYHRSIRDPDRLIPVLLNKKNKLIRKINKIQREWMGLQ